MELGWVGLGWAVKEGENESARETPSIQSIPSLYSPGTYFVRHTYSCDGMAWCMVLVSRDQGTAWSCFFRG